MDRQGRQHGTKAMIERLQLGSRHGYGRLRSAIEAALRLGRTDASAVRHLLLADGVAHQRPVLLAEIGTALARYKRPLPHVNAYDQLIQSKLSKSDAALSVALDHLPDKRPARPPGAGGHAARCGAGSRNTHWNAVT